MWTYAYIHISPTTPTLLAPFLCLFVQPQRTHTQVLVRELLPKLDDTLKHELVHWAAVYEHRVQIGSKEIFHLEVGP